MQGSQARHAKSMADKIKVHLQSMMWAMDSITEESQISLQNVPVENVTEQFRILERRWEEIQSVIRDMEPEL